MNEENNASLTSSSRPIGVAWMSEDRTIHLRLRAEGEGIIGDSLLSYPPDHPEYQEILDHLAGLEPGQYKSVPPWPDESDDTTLASPAATDESTSAKKFIDRS